MAQKDKNANVVVIGGGTGTFVALSGLKKYPLNLSAIITMMDSGGSTGRLRDQLGVLPPGDLRQALVALSSPQTEQVWRDLFVYRFDNGDLDGHNFGNIFISALEKITGSLDSAIELATKLLGSSGDVLPVTFQRCHLYAKLEDGSLLESEAVIDDSSKPRSKIIDMYISPYAKPNVAALSTIQTADYIVFGPGDLYTSIVPNLLIDGISDALVKSNAKKIYVLNLMTKLGQTQGYKASDHLNELEKYAKTKIDTVLVNNQKPSTDLISWYYKSAHNEPVENNLNPKIVVKKDLVAETTFHKNIADRTKRSFIRHDSEKLAKVIFDIVDNNK